MSKNMTKKGLAVGAMVALASSAFVGIPAQAAVSDSIVTGLTSGTSYNGVVGYSTPLSLSTVLAPSNAANEATLHYRVSNPSGANLTIKVGNTNVSVQQVTADGSGNSGEIWATDAVAISAVDSDGTESGFQTALTSFNVIPTGNQVGDATYDSLLTIAAEDDDADVSVTVYAWLDSSSNAANVQADTELYGNSVTLNFYDQANIAATTTMVAPVTGAASVSATTTTVPELNGQQLGADFIDVAFTAQGNANAVLAENTYADVAVDTTNNGTTTYSGVTKTWTSTAYLKYSLASDAWNGTNGTVDAIADLTSPQSQVATGAAAAVTGTITATMTAIAHGITSDGTFVGTWNNLVSALAIPTPAVDFIGVPLTYLSSSSLSWASSNSTENGELVASKGAENLAGDLAIYSVGTYATVQALGTYSARPYIGATALGAVGSSVNTANSADDTKAVIAVSENNDAGYSASATEDIVTVRTGTTSVTATATVYYTDSDDYNRVKKVAAGVPVTGTLTVNSGTFQINAAGAGVTSDVEYTDANGQVSFTVTTTTASSVDNDVDLVITPQSIAASDAGAAKFALHWNPAAYTLFDMNSTVPQGAGSSYRHINTSGTYTYGFALLDQWGKAASASLYRLQVINEGRTVSSDTHTLSNGRVNVTVADAAQGSGSTITTTANVQKLASGTWTTQTDESWDGTGVGRAVINVAAASTETITIAGSSDLTDPIAAADVVAQDRRTSAVTSPTYTNDVQLDGRVSNSATGVAKGGTLVTLTGDSSILFVSGDVDSFGSITVMADGAGDFSVDLFSNKAQKDSVITLTTANGASKTQKVTFSPVGALDGTTLVITSTPAAPGMTTVFTGTLTDDYGNAVDTNQGTNLGTDLAQFVVTYTGPGLVSQTLATETGTDGTFTVRVLLGANDTGTATVTATYGAANGTIAAADTGLDIDISASLSVAVTANVGNVGDLASWTKNLNDGTVKMYAKNIVGAGKVQFMLNGEEIAWVRATSAADSKLRTANGASYLVRTVDLVEGQKNVLEIYVDGVRTARTAYTY